ncbi:helix-turn-helix transcriptional regulator [candidate division KSB1 bacterium]
MDEEYILENRLRVARAEKEITQANLAAIAGVSRQTIIAIESRHYNPSVKLAFILAKCLGKDINELFSIHGPYNKECE